jgi:hypothetical protein
MKSLWVAVCTIAWTVSPLTALAAEREIIVYGQNAPEWNRSLGVTATRGSCNGPVETCMSTIGALLAGQHTSRFYLNLFDEPKTNLARAAAYSERSLAEPRLRELGIDDFPDHFNGWCRDASAPCDAYLGQLIDATKSKNPALAFGVTIYEDQIDALLANPRLTKALRGRIDLVHLFFHDRRNGPAFESWLSRIKQAFPRARVIGGSYPYDRLDYEKCADKAACVPAEARELQEKTLRVEAKLLATGAIAGIEFYPGHFGWEERWPAWDNPRICKPEHKAACIANTKAMHADAAAILRAK